VLPATTASSTALRHAVLGLVLVLSLTAAACSGSDESSSSTATSPSTASTAAPSTTPAVDLDQLDANGFPVNWTPPPLEWSACDAARGAECATLAVPLDWTDPTGTTVDLALARIPASGERIGSLFVNPGGPGASGIAFLRGGFPDAVSERFDLVSWDPRGVGASAKVVCGSTASQMLALDPDPDDDTEQAALQEQARALSADCARSDLSLLQHIGTSSVARDVEGMRRATGGEPLNYLGFSYGTQIGQEYAEMFPEHLRAMVLDGVVDPSLGYTEFLLGQTMAFERSFDANDERCRDEGVARCGVRSLGDAYDDVLDEVDEVPLSTPDGPVGPSELAIAAVATSYSDNGWQELGPALQSALEGNGRDLRSLADRYRSFGSYATYAGVVCTDTPPPADELEYERFAEAARKISPRLGGSIANELLPCATWPVEPTGLPAAVHAPGAPPILVVGNEGDAATPYENAVAVADALESGVLVSADIGGHTAYGVNRCVTKVVDAYLIDLVVPSKDPHCT